MITEEEKIKLFKWSNHKGLERKLVGIFIQILYLTANEYNKDIVVEVDQDTGNKRVTKSGYDFRVFGNHSFVCEAKINNSPLTKHQLATNVEFNIRKQNYYILRFLVNKKTKRLEGLKILKRSPHGSEHRVYIAKKIDLTNFNSGKYYQSCWDCFVDIAIFLIPS